MIGTFVEALRPHQWTKNLVLFAGIAFSQQLLQRPLALRAVAGFAAFCLLSGAIYVLNDLKDLEADRVHPRKRLRPLPSGRLSQGAAFAGLMPVLAAAGALSWWLGERFATVAAIYVALNVAYSLWLKNQVILDVFSVAIGFVLRAIAGVQLLLPVSPDTDLSAWLLVCTFFLSLFLGFAKRRRELMNVGSAAQAGQQRPVLDHYTPEFLDGVLWITAASSLMSYALYTIWPETQQRFHGESMLFTVPFVAYGLFRFVHLVRVNDRSEDAAHVLVTDRPLGLCVVLYVATVLVLLYRS